MTPRQACEVMRPVTKQLASYSYPRQIRIESDHVGDGVAGQNKSWL